MQWECKMIALDPDEFVCHLHSDFQRNDEDHFLFFLAVECKHVVR